MWLLSAAAWAGMGPPHTLVLYNARTPDAEAVAQAYADARNLPPGHLCPITGLEPNLVRIDFATYADAVRGPLEECLAALPQPDEIDVLVTVRGLPYLVDLESRPVGFEALLQVGRGQTPDGVELAGLDNGASASVPNPTYVGDDRCPAEDLTLTNGAGPWYDGACALTRATRFPRTFARANRHTVDDWAFTGELFVVGRLDGFDFDDALALVERGVAADGAAPQGTFLCMHGADPARAARDPECEYTVRRLRESGADATWIDAFDGELAGETVVAYFTGAANLRDAIEGQTYAPGAIACNLTSFGAVPENFLCDETSGACPAQERQTSVARFIRAGATGAHGTVAEPLNNSFPNASAMLLYADGYSLGESFLYSQRFLYWYNLVLGDPLATPFARRPTVSIQGVGESDVLVVANHPDGIERIVLYADGVRVEEVEDIQLEYRMDGPAGTEMELLAVATAASADIGRPDYDDSATPPTGWDTPTGTQRLRPSTQGWVEATMVVGAMDEPPEGTGCGCTTGPSPGSGWVLWALLGVWWRRQRAVPTRSSPPTFT